MSEAPSKHRSISKRALAKLLGLAEKDLLTRGEAAEAIGLGERTLGNIAKSGPAYYCSTTGSTAGEVWYPRAEVDAFAAHRESPIKSTYRGRLGRQEWTSLQDDAERLSAVHPSFFVLTAMFERAWGDVLEAETRWRNFDYTGMPDHQPLTISDVSISVSLKA